jgi:tripeptide aminopeptidase
MFGQVHQIGAQGVAFDVAHRTVEILIGLHGKALVSALVEVAVPDFVTVRAEARSHDRNFSQRIVEHIEQAFRQAVHEVRNVAGNEGSVEMDGRLDYESFRLADDEPCVLASEAAVRAIGRQPERAVANGGVDANWTTAHGIPTVTLGCGQLNQHMVSEALAIDDFQDACRLALLLATASEA